MTESGGISNQERRKEPKLWLVERSERQRAFLSIHVVGDLALFMRYLSLTASESLHRHQARDEDSEICYLSLLRLM